MAAADDQVRVPERSSDTPRKNARAPIYSTKRVRQGDVVLRTPAMRGIFIAGLAGAVVLVLILAFAAWA